MERILNMAVSQVHFKCRETWFVQKNVLVMVAKEYEHPLKLKIPEVTKPDNICKEMCPNATKKLPTGQKGESARET